MANVRFNNAYAAYMRKQTPKLTEAEMQRLRRDCIRSFMSHNEELLEEQYIDMGRVITTCYCIALHRHCGWSQKRLGRLVEQVAEIMTWVNNVSWDKGEARLEQLEAELKRECRIVLKHDKEAEV